MSNSGMFLKKVSKMVYYDNNWGRVGIKSPMGKRFAEQFIDDEFDDCYKGCDKCNEYHKHDHYDKYEDYYKHDHHHKHHKKYY